MNPAKSKRVRSTEPSPSRARAGATQKPRALMRKLRAGRVPSSSELLLDLVELAAAVALRAVDPLSGAIEQRDVDRHAVAGSADGKLRRREHDREFAARERARKPHAQAPAVWPRHAGALQCRLGPMDVFLDAAAQAHRQEAVMSPAGTARRARFPRRQGLAARGAAGAAQPSCARYALSPPRPRARPAGASRACRGRGRCRA